jgi:hypothetical protein
MASTEVLDDSSIVKDAGSQVVSQRWNAGKQTKYYLSFWQQTKIIRP